MGRQSPFVYWPCPEDISALLMQGLPCPILAVTTVYDYSLDGATGRKISGFRMQRPDTRHPVGPNQSLCCEHGTYRTRNTTTYIGLGRRRCRAECVCKFSKSSIPDMDTLSFTVSPPKEFEFIQQIKEFQSRHYPQEETASVTYCGSFNTRKRVGEPPVVAAGQGTCWQTNEQNAQVTVMIVCVSVGAQ